VKKTFISIVMLLGLFPGFVTVAGYCRDSAEDISLGALQERIEEHRAKLADLRDSRAALECEKSLLTTEIEQDIDRINALSGVFDGMPADKKKPAESESAAESAKAPEISSVPENANPAEPVLIDKESQEEIKKFNQMKQALIREKELLQQVVE